MQSFYTPIQQQQNKYHLPYTVETACYEELCIHSSKTNQTEQTMTSNHFHHLNEEWPLQKNFIRPRQLRLKPLG